MSEWMPIESAPNDGSWQVVAHLDRQCFYWWHRARYVRSAWRTGNGVVVPSYFLPLPDYEPAPERIPTLAEMREILSGASQ